jgi:hypothetical protein
VSDSDGQLCNSGPSAKHHMTLSSRTLLNLREAKTKPSTDRTRGPRGTKEKPPPR